MPDPPWSEHRAYRVAAVRAGPLRQDQTVPFLARLDRFRHAIGLSGFLILMSVLACGPAAAQGSVRKTFDDWQLRCETPAGAKAEQCALVQYLAAEDRPNLSLVVIVLKTADNRGYLLRVVAPLGVLLPSGLGLKIDQTDIGRAGFVRCLTTGCVAEVVMDSGLIQQFKNGSKATFIVFQTPEEGVGIPLSMKGFATGFDSLK